MGLVAGFEQWCDTCRQTLGLHTHDRTRRMKQHITTEQWNEVAIEQQKKFWDTDEPADFLLPSIGQMIKFLDESSDHFNTAYTQGDDPQIKRNRTIVWEYDEDLCDVLWKDVKRELDQGFGA